MTISELIEILEQRQAEFGEDTEVQILYQESRPIYAKTFGVIDSEELAYDEDSGNERVFIVVGSDLGYGSREAWLLCQRNP